MRSGCGGTLRKGAANDIFIGVVTTITASLIMPYAASFMGGFMGYIYLHKNGKIDFSAIGLIETIALAGFLGYVSKKVFISYGVLNSDVVDPVIGLIGFVSPKILDMIYSLDFVGILRKLK